MEELSIEEKAKAYDEALERARIWKDKSGMPKDKQGILDDIFPELKESEDEKIRKALIQIFNVENFENYGIKNEEVIAWLEKQGETSLVLSNSSNIGKDAWSEEEQNRFAKGVLTSCALSFIDYLDAHKYEGKMCVSNGECEDIENAFHNAMWDRLHRYYCKYIEKQGEQKPADKKGMNLVEEEMTPFQKKVFCIIDTTIEEEQGLKQVCDELLALASNEIKQKSAEWSEEDEKNSSYVVAALDAYNSFRKDRDNFSAQEKLDSAVKWLHERLKFIKPQPKQEWSEEDGRNINEILYLVEANYLSSEEPHDRLINFLKSLKYRYTWKPSNEQIKSVKEAACYSSVFSEKTIDNLISLSKQLKKLMEE